jgi:hypothetical protein
MSDPIKDGGSAFPSGLYGYDGTGDPKPDGMSLRDWFAGMALQGMFSNHAMIDTFSHHKMMAEESYNVADTMLAAREGKEES